VSWPLPNVDVNVADVLKATARNPLGVLSLLALLLCFLAYVFFKQASEKVRIYMFLLMFAAAIGLSVAVIRGASEVQQQNRDKEPTTTLQGPLPQTKPAPPPQTKPMPVPPVFTLPKTQTCPDGSVILVGDSCSELKVRIQVEMNDDYCTGPKTQRACRNPKTRFRWTLSLDDQELPSLVVSPGPGAHKFDIQTVGVDGICELNLNPFRDKAIGYVVNMHIKNRGTYEKPNFHLIGCTLDDTIKDE
jgi:hypothetical protein